MQPKHGLPDSMIRDTRRDSWVMVLPARDFLPEDYNSDRSPVEPRRLIPSGGVAQRPALAGGPGSALDYAGVGVPSMDVFAVRPGSLVAGAAPPRARKNRGP